MLRICIVFVAVLLGTLVNCSTDLDIRNLIGEPDYRKVTLHWEVTSNDIDNDPQHDHVDQTTHLTDPPGNRTFQVRYCELQTWGTQRCRTKTILHRRKQQDERVASDANTSYGDKDSDDKFQLNGNNEKRVSDEDDDGNVVVYDTDIGGLRMATTYSFEVRTAKKDSVLPSGTREFRASSATSDDAEVNSGQELKNPNVIVIPTKGFSAKATQCLPHASEIEVSTGPYFAGRIAVEAADGERCAIDGQPDSSRDTYTLRINHAECGSQVNETTVATFVLVQENLPILTHSTRRFLVLCSYQPETLTVRAGINLPTHHRGQAKITMEDGESYNKRGRSLRTGRYLQKAEALVTDEDDLHHRNEDNSATATRNESILPVALIVVLMVAVVACLIAIALKWNMKKMMMMRTPSASHDQDNISVASDLSTVSNCTSTTDTLPGVKHQQHQLPQVLGRSSRFDVVV